MQETKNIAPQQAAPQLRMRTSLRSGATTTGGGWVNNVYYPDYSGYCSGGSTPPTTPPTPVQPIAPPTQGGGWVNGIYYPDYSGYCSV